MSADATQLAQSQPVAVDAPAPRASRHFPASGEAPISVARDEREGQGVRLLATQSGVCVGAASVRPVNDGALLEFERVDLADPRAAGVAAALVATAFQAAPDAKHLYAASAAEAPALVAMAIDAAEVESRRCGVIMRAHFHQLPQLWRVAGSHRTYPHIPSRLGFEGREVPLRPPQPNGVMYRRHLSELGLELTLRPIDRRRDLALFHGWMNQKRVDFFWDLAKTREELDAYLAEQEADPHTVGTIGEVDGEPVAYFEFYWAKEDRLGAHYDAQDYDRGWHGLIGNPRFLGRARTLAWFRSLTHYLFLDDPRTMRVVGEPRASHVKMLSYCDDVAYDQVKEFDFPHKRAMLVMCRRERFFDEVRL